LKKDILTGFFQNEPGTDNRAITELICRKNNHSVLATNETIKNQQVMQLSSGRKRHLPVKSSGPAPAMAPFLLNFNPSTYKNWQKGCSEFSESNNLSRLQLKSACFHALLQRFRS